MQAEHGAVTGTKLSDEQRTAVNSARNRYELVALLTKGVVSRPTLRARLQELDDLERRFFAKHPIVFVIWNLWALAFGGILFWAYESSVEVENSYSWMTLFSAIIFVFYGIEQLLAFALLRNSRRRERALIETLPFSEQILPQEH